MFEFSKSKYKKMPFEEIIYLAQSEDVYALEELVKRVQKDVYATFCFLNLQRGSYTDLTQEVLVRMVKNIKNLRHVNSFKAWLYQIIRHVFYDDARRKLNYIPEKSIYEDDNSGIVKIPDTAMKPDEEVLASELDAAIKRAINKLDINSKEIIILRDLQGFSYEEISELTQTNIGTVKSRIVRARSKLQEYLKPYVA